MKGLTGLAMGLFTTFVVGVVGVLLGVAVRLVVVVCTERRLVNNFRLNASLLISRSS